MPEVTPEKNLEPHRQCEIRMPSLAAVLDVGGQILHKPAGYYFDIVWIRNDLARVGQQVTDHAGNIWTIAETYGSRPMARTRWSFR